MAEKLIEITRNGIVESIHNGDIAITNSRGKLLYYYGNPEKFTYFRSAAKPIQTINVIRSGAHEHFAFTDDEISIMCASHYGEPFHLKTVESILKKINLNKDYVLSGTTTSLHPDYALQLAYQRVELNQLYSDCSGKHGGMLAVCQLKNYPLENYLHPSHPCQQEILEDVAYISQMDKKDIHIGIDGCSAPVHALPLINMAIAYASFTSPSNLSDDYQEAASIIFHAMNKHPEMISGTNGFCSRLIAATKHSLIGKMGAQGVYCVGIKNKDIGIAVKIEDGSMNVLAPVVLEVLSQLNLIDNESLKELDDFRIIENKNDKGTIVGQIKPIFMLKKA